MYSKFIIFHTPIFTTFNLFTGYIASYFSHNYLLNYLIRRHAIKITVKIRLNIHQSEAPIYPIEADKLLTFPSSNITEKKCATYCEVLGYGGHQSLSYITVTIMFLIHAIILNIQHLSTKTTLPKVLII